MHTHALARELETWWKDHGSRHDDPAWQLYLGEFRSLIATKLDELGEEHVNAGEDGEKRFGMAGALGCTRKAELKLLGKTGEPFDGSTLWTFHLGHLLECAGIATMRAAGYLVDGTQTVQRIDPFMHSFSDGITNIAGVPTVLSIKTAGYKMSGACWTKDKTTGRFEQKWTRRGFAALGFEGVKVGQTSWWVQAQAEMHASGIHQCMVLTIAKDIVKVFKDDPYLESLTWYAELLPYDLRFVNEQLLPVWQQAWENVQLGKPGAPLVYSVAHDTYVRLPAPNDQKSGWGGPNQQATGTFNYCHMCDQRSACELALASEFRRAA